MNMVPLIAVSEEIDVARNIVTYKTEVESGPGIIVLCDNGEHEMLLIDQVHKDGTVLVKMKPFKMPARKYKVGNVVAILIQF